MTLRSIGPHEAKRLMDEGAILVDIREADEYAREHIPGGRHLALSQLDEAEIAAHHGRAVIFHCRSGARTRSNAAALAAKVDESCDVLMLEGGLDGWRKAGLPTEVDRRQPLELQRQVQIGAGGLALLGTILGLSISPWFFAIPLFVGGRAAVCRSDRVLRHGRCCSSARLGTVPPASPRARLREARGRDAGLAHPGRARHHVRWCCRLFARPCRRRRIDPGGAAADLPGGCAERARGDRHERARRRRQCRREPCAARAPGNGEMALRLRVRRGRRASARSPDRA